MTKRDLRRDARRADLARVQTARRQALLKKKRQEQTRRYAFIAAGVIIALLVAFLIYHFSSQPVPTKVTNTQGYGAGITCDTTSHDAELHYHVALNIVVNGKLAPLPAQVGFGPNGCLNWIHTHDSTGVVHIEAPTGSRTFVLGDFLDIWQNYPGGSFPYKPQVISSTQFLGLPLNSTQTLTIYVNGQKYTGDPNKIPLKSLETIWIEYGQPLVTPTPFNFQANGLSA